MSEQITEEVTEDATPPEDGGVSDSGEEKVGKEFVEFSPEAEARFKRVYGHMKQNERLITQMAEDNKKLIEKVESLEVREIDREVGGRVEELSRLKEGAFEEGDYATVTKIDNQLLDLKTKAKAIEEATKEETVVPDAEGELSETETAAVLTWAGESENGQLKRPWAQPGHPLQQKAANIGAAVIEDEDIRSQGIEAILVEVDRLMGTKLASTGPTTATVTTPAVLSGDGNVRPASGKKTPLTEDQKLIARKMNMTEDAYRSAMTKWG